MVGRNLRGGGQNFRGGGEGGEPDGRGRAVLASIVREYIERGEPVGSRTLARVSDLNLSAATMRNVMSDLEVGGFLVSPHTSAGRVPSARGIRFFVDRLLTTSAPSPGAAKKMQGGVGGETMRDVLLSAARTVSELTKFAGFVVAPPRAPAVKSLRFVRLSPGRALAVIVTPDGEILNRIVHCDRALSEREMRVAAGFYNRQMSGLTFAEAEAFLRRKVISLRGEIADLLRRMLHASNGDNDDDVQVAGEFNLLEQRDLSADLDRLRKLHRLLRRKSGILHLIDKSRRAEDVRVFIGNECGHDALADCSVVLAKVGADGGMGDGQSPLGFVGVIGPKRMRYPQVIATVNLASATIAEEWRRMRAALGE